MNVLWKGATVRLIEFRFESTGICMIQFPDTSIFNQFLKERGCTWVMF